MTSLNQLRKDLETVRRALSPSDREYYRQKSEELMRILDDYQRQVEAEAAMLTGERAEELWKIVSKDPETIDDACQLAHIHNVLSEYQQKKNVEE